jgi:hypothetical protein
VVKPLDPMRIRRATRALVDGGTYHDESFLPVPTVVAGSEIPTAVAATPAGA